MKLPPSLIPNIFNSLVIALTTGLSKGITVHTDAKKTKLNYSVNVDNSSIKINEDNNLEIIESDPIFSAWDKSTGINITEAQISDFGTYLTEEVDPVFTASQAANITSDDITKLSNLSGTNTGDQDLSGLMAKTQNLADVANQQTALNNITAVSGATNEHVLTKDTATGNATWKASTGSMGGSGFKYGYYTLSANQTTNLANTNPVKFDTYTGSLGAPSLYNIALSSGKTYKFTWSVAINGVNAYFRIYNTTNSVQVGEYSFNGSTSIPTSGFIIYTPPNNCNVQLQIINPYSLTSIITGYGTHLLIEEYGGY